MHTFDRLAYVLVTVLAFACGLLTVSVVPGNMTQGAPILGKNWLFTALLFGSCILASGTTAYIVAYSVRSQSRWLLILVRLFYIALPAIGAAFILSALLSSLGLVGLAHSRTFLTLIAASDISAGLTGIAAMKSIPEYRQVFPRLGYKTDS